MAHAFPAKDADLRVVGLGVEHLPSLSIYVQRPIEHLPDAATLAHRLRLPMPVYALVTEEAWDAFRAAHPNLGRETSRRFDLYRNRATILVVNQL